MSSEITTPTSEPVTCPYCQTETKLPVFRLPPVQMNTVICNVCGIPFVSVIRPVTVYETTVHKLEGIEDIYPRKKAPVIPTMEEIEQGIEEESFYPDHDIPTPEEIAAELHDDDDLQESGISVADSEMFHCTDCGFNYPITMKASHGDICKACETEQPESEYISLPGSKTVSYCINGDCIKLRYNGNDCNSYTCDIIWSIVDSPQNEWMSLIDDMLKDEKNRIQKSSALNQLCKAVHSGSVKICGGGE